MANKTLTASVKLDVSSAEKSLASLSKKINNLEKSISKIGKATKLEKDIQKQTIAQEKLKQAVAKTALAEERVRTQKERTRAITEKIKVTTDRTVTSANRLRSAFSSANTGANTLLTTVKRLASTYLGIMGMKAIITTSDGITSAQNRLNNLEGGNPQLTRETMDKTYLAAQRSRSSYSDMLGNVSKTMTLAGGAFDGNVNNAIRFQEIMAKAYTIGGASAAEQSSSMYQLMQALGSGVLQGDELRSVREGAPIAYQKIEEFAQGVLNTTESLKELASQGKITSDMVVAAIMDAGTKIDTQFENTSMTFAQAWEKIKSAAVKAFEPVSNMLNEALNKAAESGVFEKIEVIFWNISKAIQIAFQIIYNVVEAIATAIQWIGDNWNWLSKVILNVLSVIGIAMAVILFPKFIAWLQYLAFAIMYYSWVGLQAVASALKTAAAWAIANWQMLLIIVVIAAIVTALIWLSDSFADACGMIVGVIMTAIAFVWNLFIGIVNALVQFLWTFFAEPFIGIIELIVNACQGGFNTFGDGVKNLIGWFLSLGQVVTQIIDAIFGTNWTGGLESLKGELLKWGKNEKAITISREAPTVLNRWDYGDAYGTGYDWGYSAGSWITDKVSGIGESLSLDGIGEKLGLKFDDSLVSTDPSKLGIADSYNPDKDKLLSGIANDTGSIADSMELSAEDLEYLRKLAEMEWKKEYTSNNITIDMTNYNSVERDGDLDGIVTKLTDRLRTELNVMANGVYA